MKKTTQKKSRGNMKSGDRGEIFYGAIKSPVGNVYAALDGDKVVAINFGKVSESAFRKGLSSRLSRPVSRSDKIAGPLLDELRKYFAGTLKKFSFAPDLAGNTDFQKRALKATISIPYGETRSYGWLAGRAGSPRAARAAGQVMATNSIPIIIPCHRVIGSSGNLCGFGGAAKALDLKSILLAIESGNT